MIISTSSIYISLKFLNRHYLPLPDIDESPEMTVTKIVIIF